jgi:hypothetical protein
MLQKQALPTLNKGSTTTRASKQMQAKMILEILAVDRDQGKTILKGWERHLSLGSGRQQKTEFNSLEDYLQYRTEDVAWS